MTTSFVENVNLLASKVDIVEEANSLFDENVIPILEEIADLDLDAAVEDLLKGNYLGNRKIDINLALNVQGITEELLLTDPDQAEVIWTDKSKTVQYDKAIITFTDGEVITLPFIFDNVPVTISTHGDLLAQLSRLDYTYAVSQVDSIYQVNVRNSTEYIITIDNVECKYSSPETATTKEVILAGIANSINNLNISVKAVIVNGGSKLNLVAKVPGVPFFASTSDNLTLTNVTPNSVEGPKETAFSAKLTGTLAANFAAPVVGEIVRLYDVIGQNSNIERISLHAVSGKYIEEYTLFYWAKTTSAFQTLSMRANDIIRLGDEIDNIIKLASRIGEIIELQGKLPQLIDTYSTDGVPNGDLTIYNSLDELVAVHVKLNEIVTVFHDVKEYGTKYIEAVALNLRGDNTIGTVATDLRLGVDSNVIRTGEHITDVTTVSSGMNDVAVVSTNIDSVNTVSSDLKLGVNSAVKNTGDNITKVNTVSTNITKVDTVASDLDLGVGSAIKKTSENISSVNTVSDNIGKVIATANNETNINRVVNEVIPNLPEILLSDDNASLAKLKAEEAIHNATVAIDKAAVATNAAAVATAKSNEIKSVSVGSTLTGAPGTNASVVYNPTNGKFTFVVPQGIKGDKGEAFTVNSVGIFAQRVLYDNQVTGFSYLAVDVIVDGSTVPHIYFKKSGTSGDWTTGIPFGRGEKGEPGVAGSSITQVTFDSTDHSSNLPSQPGSIDTYKAIYTDGTFNTFTVYNGKDSDFNSDTVSTLTNKTINDSTNTVGANHVHITVVNNTGSVITKGTPVRKASVQDNLNYLCIEPCSDNNQFAIGITYNTFEATSGTLGRIITTGSITNVNTDIWGVGDTLYIGANGSLSNIKPTTPAYQVCGVVQVKSATKGVILVNMNDTYNNNNVSLQGNQTISDVKTFTSTIVGSISGNAGTATRLQSARKIAGTSFDGSADINILFANISNTPTTLGGYNITDAYTATEVGTMAEFTANLN